MALSLGVRIGDVVDIAEHWLTVLSVDSHNSATLIGDEGEKTAITATDMVEVFPSVWVGLAPRTSRSRLRLVFDAPWSISITRRQDEEQT